MKINTNKKRLYNTNKTIFNHCENIKKECKCSIKINVKLM